MTLLFFFISRAISKTYTYEHKLEDTLDKIIENEYDRAQLRLPAGTCLMMVEWDDAILSISVPQISKNEVKLTKHLGFSVFLFHESASIDIIFHSKLSFSVFPCPLHSSLDGAMQYISNFATNEVKFDTVSNAYVKVFDEFSMTGNLKKSQIFGTVELCYNQGLGWVKTKNIESVNLQGLRYYAVILPSFLNLRVQGSLTVNCKRKFNPTVPTNFVYSIDQVINENKNNYKESVAYGGIGVNQKSISFNSLVNTQYVTISNNIVNSRYYNLFAVDANGRYKLISTDVPYIEARTNNFKVKVYIRSIMGLENCSDYTFIKEIYSSRLRIEDTNLVYEKIIDEHIPKVCYYEESSGDGNEGSGNGSSGGGKNNNRNKAGLIVGVVIAVIVVIAIVVVVVIFVLKKKKSDQSTQEVKVTSTSSLI